MKKCFIVLFTISSGLYSFSDANGQYIVTGEHSNATYYQDFIPDITVQGAYPSPPDTFWLDMNNDNSYDFILRSCACRSLASGSPLNNIIPLNGSELAFGYTDSCLFIPPTIYTKDMAFPFLTGDTINSNLSWVNTSLAISYAKWTPYMIDTTYYLASCSDHPFLPDSIEHYIGVRLNSSGQYMYGWINVTGWSNAVTVKEYALGIGPLSINTKPLMNSISPNPFIMQTVLQTSVPFINATLKLYNISGQEVRQINQVSGNSVTILRGDLVAGVYLLQVLQQDEIIASRKIVISDN